MTPSHSGSTQLWITLAILALVVGRFLLRELRPRRIPNKQMYAIPLLVLAIAVYLEYTAVQVTALYGIIVPGTIAAVIVGAVLGLVVAQLTLVTTEPGVTIVRGSYVTVAIWLGALALRFIGRLAVGTSDPKVMLALNAVLVMLVAAALLSSRYGFARKAQLAGVRG
jgi:fucose permease